MPIGELITWRQLAGDPRLSGALTECDAREWMHWRYEQQIGWDGQKRAVRERNRRKHPPAVPMFRKLFTYRTKRLRVTGATKNSPDRQAEDSCPRSP